MSATIQAIEGAAANLLYRSEADHPLQLFRWEDGEPFTLHRLLKRVSYAPDTAVETLTLDGFFRHAMQIEDWHAEPERAAAVRFKSLVSTLKEHLRDITVYKVGTINIDVYIVGQTADGDYAGLMTKAVET